MRAIFQNNYMNILIFSALLSFAFPTYPAFASPDIALVFPAPPDNFATGNNWVFVNMTSSEDASQSLLEWGNASGFTNVSMFNLSASATNWFANMTGLADGIYNYTVWAQNLTGDWGQSGRRRITVDTVAPSIAFTNSTISSGNATANSWAYINVSSGEPLSVALLEWSAAQNSTMSASGANYYFNMTGLSKGNYTFRVYAQDAAGNWNATETRSLYVRPPVYPQYSGMSINSTQKGASALFSLQWSDEAGLSGFIFSTNISGTWQNTTWQPMAGTENISAAIKTLSSINGASRGYRFYANNTNGRWNNTGILIITTTCAESWTFGAWGLCIKGFQKRTSSDANNCGTTNMRGPVSQICGGENISSANTMNVTAKIEEPLTKIAVILRSSAPKPSLNASKVSSVPAPAPGGNAYQVYQYLNITKANFSNTDIANATVEFRVQKMWLAKNNIQSVYLARYDVGWNLLKTLLVKSDSTYNTYSAEVEGFSYFAIIGGRAGAEALNPANGTASNASTGGSGGTTKPVSKPARIPEAIIPESSADSESGTGAWTLILIFAVVAAIAGGAYLYLRDSGMKFSDVLRKISSTKSAGKITDAPAKVSIPEQQGTASPASPQKPNAAPAQRFPATGSEPERQMPEGRISPSLVPEHEKLMGAAPPKPPAFVTRAATAPAAKKSVVFFEELTGAGKIANMEPGTPGKKIDDVVERIERFQNKAKKESGDKM